MSVRGPRVAFFIKDETSSIWHNSYFNLYLPYTRTVFQLYWATQEEAGTDNIQMDEYNYCIRMMGQTNNELNVRKDKQTNKGEIDDQTHNKQVVIVLLVRLEKQV